MAKAFWAVEELAHKPNEEDPMCDWHAVVRLKHPGKRALYMFLQFGSHGVAQDEAHDMVDAVLSGLNGTPR